MLAVREATPADAELLLAWRNDPETRRWSRTTDPVDAADHRAWLRRTLDNERRILLVGDDTAGPVGTVRWDLEDDGSWEVSLTVAPERRGSQLSGPLLDAAEGVLHAQVPPPVPLLAVVHQDNAASVRLFTHAGYRPSWPAADGGFAVWDKTLF